MYEQLALFPDSEITAPEPLADPEFRIVPLHPQPIFTPQPDMLPLDEDAA